MKNEIKRLQAQYGFSKSVAERFLRVAKPSYNGPLSGDKEAMKQIQRFFRNNPNCKKIVLKKFSEN